MRFTGIEGVDAVIDRLDDPSDRLHDSDLAEALVSDVERLIERHDVACQLLIPGRSNNDSSNDSKHLPIYRKAVRRAIEKVDDLIG